MTIPSNTGSHTVTISIPYRASSSKFLLENKKFFFIGAATLVIGLSIGMPIGAFIYDRITNAGLASCSYLEETSSSFSWGTTLAG